ncbi:MAG: hypothetical protein WA952_07715 [Lewinella sp.]
MRTSLIAFCFLLAACLYGQESFLHLDRPYYAAGEVSRFQVYLPQPAPGIVRAEVYAPDGALVDYFFLRSGGGGTADGYYRWGYDLPTGYYRLRFAALTEQQTTVDLGTYPLPVYQVSDRRGDAGAASETTPSAPADDLTVNIADGRVTASGLPDGVYSLAVRNREVTGQGSSVRSAAASAGARYVDTLFYGGRLTTPETGEAIAVNLLPFFDNRTLKTYFSKSDDEGDFLITLPSFEGEKQVQAYSVKDEAIDAGLSFPPLEALSTTPPLTEEVLAYLDLSNRRRKIYQLYGGVETPLDATPAGEEMKMLNPNRDYNVQDYKSFPDMLTFFNEVAGELRVRERRGVQNAQLYNAPNQRFFSDTPLFIVDGRLTRDVAYITSLAPAGVDRLAYYYDNRELRRDFPALGSYGVVQIDLTGDAGEFPEADAANILTIQGVLPEQAFGVTEEDAPRLSPLLLWQSGEIDGGTLTVDLPATDDPGAYEVVLVVRDTESGALSVGRAEVTLTASR